MKTYHLYFDDGDEPVAVPKNAVLCTLDAAFEKGWLTYAKPGNITVHLNLRRCISIAEKESAYE